MLRIVNVQQPGAGLDGAQILNETSVWRSSDYATHGSFVPLLGAEVLRLLDVQPDELILDVGCGDGVLTRQIAASGADVVGVDASADLLQAARESGTADVRLIDAEALVFDSEFDAVFSNAALHWMTRPDRVAEGVFRALKPGGRFVAEMGGFGNIAAVLTALAAVMQQRGHPDADPGQFYPTTDQYGAILAKAGFTEFSGQLIPRQTLLRSGIEPWLRTFRTGFLDAHQISPAEQKVIIHETAELLRPTLYDHAGNWYADYVRLRFTARKP